MVFSLLASASSLLAFASILSAPILCFAAISCCRSALSCCCSAFSRCAAAISLFVRHILLSFGEVKAIGRLFHLSIDRFFENYFADVHFCHLDKFPAIPHTGTPGVRIRGEHCEVAGPASPQARSNERPPMRRPHARTHVLTRYLSCVEMLPNVAFSLVPMPLTAG